MAEVYTESAIEQVGGCLGEDKDTESDAIVDTFRG